GSPGGGAAGGAGVRGSLAVGGRPGGYLPAAHRGSPRLMRPPPLPGVPLLLLTMHVAACAPRLQPLGPMAATTTAPKAAGATAGERLSMTTPAPAADRLVMDDGVTLPLRHWPARGPAKAVILALHGFHDYSR